jgi:hypothetical protein
MTQQAFVITEADRAILLALSRYHYLTAAQASRLLYPNLSDDNRYSQRRLKRLTDAQYVMPLRALPPPRVGRAPQVYTLARRGRHYLDALGVSLRPYFRPSEETRATENSRFMAHRLAAIDVMIAADRLCRDYPVSCPRMLSERELKQGALRVDVPPRPDGTGSGIRRVAVIPDAWFQLSVAGGPPLSIAVELDRATEEQVAWRQKVAAYVVWASGPYREAFKADNLTIAVVCPDARRLAVLTGWTMRELTARGAPELADIFLFTAASPVTAAPGEFFFSPVWWLPHQPQPVGLLEPLPPAERREYLHVV